MAIFLFIAGLFLSYRGLSMQSMTRLPMDMTTAEYGLVKKKRMIRNLLILAGSILLVLSIVLLMAGLFTMG
jgi:hypothetical protein